MGHNIRAFIGKEDVISKMASSWLMEYKPLKQGYALLFLTDRLFDDMTELEGSEDQLNCKELNFFTTAIQNIMEPYTFRQEMAYIETDYFGGIGTQAGLLMRNQQIIIGPQQGAGTINVLLREMGVYCEKGQDEFASLELYKYRRMELC